jgi:hypothetical protein
MAGRTEARKAVAISLKWEGGKKGKEERKGRRVG